LSIKLAEHCVEAVTDAHYETGRGWCYRFIRQNIEALYGHKYTKYDDDTAKKAAARWQRSRYALPDGQTAQIGDICFWTHAHGPNGHVAIRVKGNRYCENSIVHDNGTSGGKGFRGLDEMGKPDLIIRLPEPNQA
jgi:hypothetical protein